MHLKTRELINLHSQAVMLVSQEDWSKEEEGPWPLICTDDLLYINQAQDVSVGSPEILD